MTRNQASSKADMISLDPEKFGIDELHKMIFEGKGPLPKVLALSVLRRKDYPDKIRDLKRVLMNEREEPRTRHAAAIELSRLGSPEAAAALRQGLKVKHSLVVRGAKSGLAALGEVAPDSTQHWPQTLLRYQKGIAETKIPFPAPSKFIALGKANEVQFHPANDDVAALAIQHVAASGLSLTLRAQNAIALQCGQRDLLLLFTESLINGEAAKSNRPAVLGVVAAHYTEESDHWSPNYLVLSQPSRQHAELQVLVTSSTGVVVLGGMAKLAGQHADFALKAVRQPGTVPIEVEGAYDGGKIHLTRVRSQRTMLSTDDVGP
ncbi:MAG TPA: HEAT repeat domain-containing protein [Chthoniobacterales bacterium]|jgi:hypothetical protein